MSIFDSIYWKMPVLAQKFMGVWPYKKKTYYDKFMRIAVYLSLLALIVPLGVKLFQELGYNNEIAVENLFGEMYLNAGVIKFSAAIFNKKKQKKVYDLIQNDWKATNDKEELRIMEKHAGIARRVAIGYGICCCSTATCFLSIPLLVPFLDYIVPIENVTRRWELPIYAEYFVDQEKYLIQLMFTALVSGMMSMVVFISYDMAFAMCVQHVCSLFEIINLRLHRASSSISKIDNPEEALKNQEIAHEYIIKSIKLHQIVIENVLSLEDCYNKTWFIILILNTTAIGSGLVIVLIKLRKSIPDLIRYGMFVATVLIHKYFIFLPGQKIIDYSVEVFDHCYGCKWYNLSAKSKALIRIIMIRSLQPCNLSGGKMFILRMETYASMMKTAMSYFTVFASTQS